MLVGPLPVQIGTVGSGAVRIVAPVLFVTSVIVTGSVPLISELVAGVIAYPSFKLRYTGGKGPAAVNTFMYWSTRLTTAVNGVPTVGVEMFPAMPPFG